jgi:hypothetical protein
MAEWISCDRGFIQADVVKWREGDMGKARPYNKGKVVRDGDRLMIAEVLQESDDEGWCLLLVRGCVILESTATPADLSLHRAHLLRRSKPCIMPSLCFMKPGALT